MTQREPDPDRVDEQRALLLVQRFQAGDRVAFRELYLTWYERVYAYVRLTLPAGEDAEAATQSVFARALERLALFEFGETSFRVWLASLARGEVTRRTGERRVSASVQGATVAARRPSRLEALAWVGDRELLTLIRKLPLPERHVLLLGFVFGLDRDEIDAVHGAHGVAVALERSAIAFLHARLSNLGSSPRTDRDSLSARELDRVSNVLYSRRRALAFG